MDAMGAGLAEINYRNRVICPNMSGRIVVGSRSSNSSEDYRLSNPAAGVADSNLEKDGTENKRWNPMTKLLDDPLRMKPSPFRAHKHKHKQKSSGPTCREAFYEQYAGPTPLQAASRRHAPGLVQKECSLSNISGVYR